ncbi:uncharacterized protein [Palaemon carinicauda]|uniref:uncharacterized protein isoform X2 n=1 Tax=Palaemon carinicauda TaxID=392227 RepID=UPI0035B62185
MAKQDWLTIAAIAVAVHIVSGCFCPRRRAWDEGLDSIFRKINESLSYFYQEPSMYKGFPVGKEPVAEKLECGVPRCGREQCNRTLRVSPNSIDYWISPNYPKPYPEDVTCTLTLILPKSQPRIQAMVKVVGEGRIFQSSGQCQNGDHLLSHYTQNDFSFLCGNITGKSWILEDCEDIVHACTFSFVSTSRDGGKDIGFELRIEGHSKQEIPDYSRKGIPDHSRKEIPDYSRKEIPDPSRKEIMDPSIEIINSHRLYQSQKYSIDDGLLEFDPYAEAEYEEIEREKENCDRIVEVFHKSMDFWATPNLPNPYPEDIACTLTVVLPRHQKCTKAVVKMVGEARIFSSSDQCYNGDHLLVHNTQNDVSYFCGNVSGKSWTLSNCQDQDLSFTFSFISTSLDGGNDAGFMLSIEGFVLVPK